MLAIELNSLKNEINNLLAGQEQFTCSPVKNIKTCNHKITLISKKMKTINRYSLFIMVLLCSVAFSVTGYSQTCSGPIYNTTNRIIITGVACAATQTFEVDFVWDDGLGTGSSFYSGTLPGFTSFDLTTDAPGTGATGTGFVLELPAGADLPYINCIQVGTALITVRKQGVLGLDVAYIDNVLQPDCLIECPVLPITLQSFSSQFTNGQVKLQWVTAQESNSSHFWVQESCDGANFVRIAKIAAAGTSSYPITYNYTDPTFCKPRSFYRLEMVDDDCKRKFSQILLVTTTSCSSCPSTPPTASSAYDPCAGVYDVKITGPDLICNNPNYALYRLKNKPNGATVTWSVSSSGYATVSGTSAYARVQRSNNYSGSITLTATFSTGSGPVTKSINLGAQPIPVTTGQYYSGYTLVHTATVSSPLPGTSSYDYTWYLNGNYIGTGLSQTFYVNPQSSVYYDVHVTTNCGESVYYGYVYNPNSGGGGGNPPCDFIPFKIAPNPVKGFVNLRPLPCDQQLPYEVKTKVPEVYTVRIYDQMRTLRKVFNNVRIAAGGSVKLAIGDLPRGNYIVELYEGKRKGSNWIIVE